MSYCLRDQITGRFVKDHKHLQNNFCPDSISVEHAYWLGFLLADGCMYNTGELRVCLARTDANYGHLVNLKNFIYPACKVKTYPRQVMIQITDANLQANLNHFGIVPRKTWQVITIPNEVLSPHLVFHFIRGYFDGDGWIVSGQQWNQKYQKFYPRICFGICAYHSSILYEMQNILDIPKGLSQKSNQHLFELRSGSFNKCAIIFKQLYANTNPCIRLETKYDRYHSIIRQYL